MKILRSIWLWGILITAILLWCPILWIISILDRGDPIKYKTGFFFRQLGKLMVMVNFTWKLKMEGVFPKNPRKPYVVVCNHQSLADIPLISNLPWDMKWIAKKSLFKIPVLGWMMTLAKDIPVDRETRRGAAQVLTQSKMVLDNYCSVMFFPEGTRSPNGEVLPFQDGAFRIAIQKKVDVLPLAIDGSFDCLPKNRLFFGDPVVINLKVFNSIPTKKFSLQDVTTLRDQTRNQIAEQIKLWRKMKSTSS